MIAWKVRTCDPKVASFRYRCLEPMSWLQKRGLPAALYDERRRDTLRAAVFSKVYDPAHQRLSDELRAAGCRTYLDLCDNHFYNPFGLKDYQTAGKNLRAMIARVDEVICSTPALAEVVAEEASPRGPVAVIGDAVALDPLPAEAAPGPARLLWFGHHGSPNAPCGMTDLRKIAPVLRGLASPYELVIASNSRDKYEKEIAPLGLPSRYEEWDLAGFPALLASASAVLLPIDPNPFTRCKTNNRLALALAAGVPVVADRIPSYEEFAPFCVLDDWENGLRTALTDPEAARRRARAAAPYLRLHWSEDVLAARWEALLGPAIPASKGAACR